MMKENESPTALIINFHSTKNAGDLSLLITAIDILSEALGTPTIIVSANWPDEDAYQKFGIEIVPSFWSLAGVNRDKSVLRQIIKMIWNYIRIALAPRALNDQESFMDQADWQKLRSAYQQADLIVGVSGNQFYSTGKYGWPFPASMCSVALAHVFKKPLYILPQSIGPLKRWWERALIKKYYGKARKVFLRDSVSMQLVKDLVLPENVIEYSPDPAFSLNPQSKQYALEILEKYGFSVDKPALGITLIAPMGRSLISSQVDNYYSVVTAGLEKFLMAYNAQVMIFNQVSGPTQGENDSHYSQRICQALQAKSLDIIHVNEQLDPRTLKACYGLMNAFIASRLHSGIFSLSMQVPTLFIGYLSKTKGVLTACGLEENLIEIKNLTLDLLWEKLEILWQDQEQNKQKIQAVLPQILSETTRPQCFIREDYLNVTE